jgi:serine/threonine-protein kinase
MLAIAEECAADAVAAADDSLPSLCCGSAGQAFAALTVYQATGDGHWLVDAKRIVSDTIAAVPADEPGAHRLFTGQLGVALAALELEDPARAAMPIFQAIA